MTQKKVQSFKSFKSLRSAQTVQADPFRRFELFERLERFERRLSYDCRRRRRWRCMQRILRLFTIQSESFDDRNVIHGK